MRKPLMYGVLSKNMISAGSACRKGLSSLPHHTPLGQPSSASQCIVLIEFGGKDIVRIPSDKMYMPKEIKTLLINDIAMTLNDLESIQKAEVPKGLFHDFQIQIQTGCITLSHFPALVCTEEAAVLYAPPSEAQNPVGLWSVQAPNESQSLFLSPFSMSYQQFLVCYCQEHLLHRKGFAGYRIEFELHIFSFPLLFGKATVVQKDDRNVTSFFFARTLSCVELCKLFGL